MTKTYTPIVIAEDEALKERLQGLTVEDDKDANRPVPVFYGMPDKEVRDKSWPYMTIRLVDFREGTERMMSGARDKPWYYPDPDMTVDGVDYDDWSVSDLIPVDLDYQIIGWSRQPRHNRQILAQVFGNRLPLRFGSLPVTQIKEVVGSNTTLHKTVRRLDMLGFTPRDSIMEDKRTFQNIWTVRVSSEIPSPYLGYLHKRVHEVGVGLGGYNPGHAISNGPPSFKESFTISVPVGSP